MKNTDILPNLQKDHLVYKPALDIIRFFAAFWVMLSHAQAAKGGDHGVTIFFVLSGYLIGGQLLDEKFKTGAIKVREFYFKRITRIWAPYFIVLFFYLAIFFARGQNHVEGFYGSMVGALTYTYNFVNDIRGYINPTWVSFNQIWSLSIEEQFYLVAPLFISLTPLFLILPLNIVLITLALFYAPHYAGLFIGIILAQVLRKVKSHAFTYQSSLATFAVIILIICLAWKGQSEPDSSRFILFLSALLITVGTFVNINKKYYPTLRYIGLMTYSYYLLHGVPIYFLSPIYRRMLSTDNTPIWFNIFCGILALGISYQFVKRIELPILEKRTMLLKAKSPLINFAPIVAWSLSLMGIIALGGVWYFSW